MNVRIFATALLISLGLVAVPATSAQAAPIAYSFAASTGGTYVKVLDGTVQSDLTAQSSVTGGATSRTSSNSTASATVAGLLSVGAVETTTSATVNSLGTTLRSWARTANVNLLSGLITADALETTITTTARPDGTASHTANTRLAGIKIIGINLPLTIPKNYAVTVPGVAQITLNYSMHGKIDRMFATLGWAASVTLLQPRAGYAAGVTLIVNPVNQYIMETDPAVGAQLAGTAYGTRVQVGVGDSISVVSDPTARVSTPFGSSNGKTLTNSTLGVRIPGLLTTGVVTSTSTSTKDNFGNAEILNTNQTAGLNLLGGLIKADAIKVSARGKVLDGVWTSEMSMTLVNLVIAGQKIPINVSPNTIIDVAGLGRVAINLQRKNPNGAWQNRIDAVQITLSTAQAGLPVGAVIEIGVAGTMIAPPGSGA